MNKPILTRRVAVVGVTAAVIAAGGVTAALATDSPSNVYQGCLQHNIGVLYNVRLNPGTPPNCRHRDALIGWNQAGPAGATGSRGPRGETGLAGANGTPGRAGPAGPKGDAGLAGSQGPKGDTGAKGDSGPAGSPGSALAYAHVTQDGTLDATNSKDVTVANVVSPVDGVYCFSGLTFAPHNLVAMLAVGNGANGAASRVVGELESSVRLPSCDSVPGTLAWIVTANATGANAANAFYVVFN